ncbi:hypothetical protein DFAR_490007 [Desulfarculales bacterium]
MDEDQKQRAAIFRFGVLSDFFAKDYVECDKRERLLRDDCTQRWQRSPSPTATPWAGTTGTAAGPWTRTTLRPWSVYAGICPLRQ